MESSLAARMQDLGDLELALLLSMVADEHCIFSTLDHNVSSLQEELRLTCVETLGLQPVVIACSAKTTVDEFTEALLVEADVEYDDHPDRDRIVSSTLRSTELSSGSGASAAQRSSAATLDSKSIATVIIASGLDVADDSVQVQVFELLRSKRIYTRSSMHVAPQHLLFIAILSTPGARLYRHLNDVFCMSHFHADNDSFPHLEARMDKSALPILLQSDLILLRGLLEKVFMTAEVVQYLHNIVVFMRNSRYVKGGVTATATRQMRVLSRALAPLHGLDYVPPSLVALAARKIYPHRLVLATATNERSLMWGSDLAAIKELLDGVTIEDAIEDVLASIETPL